MVARISGVLPTAQEITMEYGFVLSGMEPSMVRDLAQAAEGLNFDLVVFPDHIVHESPERQYDPHALSFDAISIATLVAAATKKIKVGHLVLCNQFRHPVITAQSLVTLDHASAGRMLAGLGAGSDSDVTAGDFTTTCRLRRASNFFKGKRKRSVTERRGIRYTM